MKLSEIVSALNELKATVSAFIGDKAKATSDAVSAFATKLSTLESGIVAELSQKTADLLTAQASISTLTAANTKLSAEATTINESLSAALASLKIEIQADASSADKISALADGVSKTLAKLNVPAESVPNNKPEPKAEAKPNLKGLARTAAAFSKQPAIAAYEASRRK